MKPAPPVTSMRIDLLDGGPCVAIEGREARPPGSAGAGLRRRHRRARARRCARAAARRGSLRDPSAGAARRSGEARNGPRARRSNCARPERAARSAGRSSTDLPWHGAGNRRRSIRRHGAHPAARRRASRARVRTDNSTADRRGVGFSRHVRAARRVPQSGRTVGSRTGRGARHRRARRAFPGLAQRGRRRARSDALASTGARVGRANAAPRHSGAGRDILAGALWGERSTLPPDLRAEFQDTGTVHVLVTAGLHLGVVAWLAIAALRAAGCGRIASSLGAIALVWLYAAFTGGHLPSLRAATMLTFWLLARATGREAYGWNALAAAAIVTAALRPASVTSLSFALSFSCVGAILLFAQPIAASLERFGLPHFAREAIALTLATQLGTWPLTAAAFLVFAPYAALANLCVIPVVGVAMLVGFAQLVFSSIPIFAQAFANVEISLLDWIVAVVRCVAALPAAHVVMTPPPAWTILAYDFALAGAAALLRVRRRTAACALLALATLGCVLPPRAAEPRPANRRARRRTGRRARDPHAFGPGVPGRRGRPVGTWPAAGRRFACRGRRRAHRRTVPHPARHPPSRRNPSLAPARRSRRRNCAGVAHVGRRCVRGQRANVSRTRLPRCARGCARAERADARTARR